MASINGVSVKNVKIHESAHEGPYMSANIYIDGHKAGKWSQDPEGGADNFSFNTSELDKRIASYVKGFKETPVLPNEQFVEMLCTLDMIGNKMEAGLEHGYIAISAIITTEDVQLISSTLHTEEEVVQKFLKEKKGMDIPLNRIITFNELSELEMTINENHPAPAVFYD